MISALFPRMAALGLVLVVACAPSGPAAVVDGRAIEWSTLHGLHPEGAELEPEGEARSLLLLILHDLLLEAAQEELGVTAEASRVEAAYQARTSGLGGDVEAVLADRGVTPERVRLEADLDVVRAMVERELVVREAPGFDLDAAYRSFLAGTARVCLRGLLVLDEAEAARAGALVADGADLGTVAEELGDAVEAVDLGCAVPLAHPRPFAPVALDGEVGRTYGPTPAADRSYLLEVTERDAPGLEEAQAEVLEHAVSTQGPDLFNAWAAEILRSAQVEVDPSLGRWETATGTGDVPTVVPA